MFVFKFLSYLENYHELWSGILKWSIATCFRCSFKCDIKLLDCKFSVANTGTCICWEKETKREFENWFPTRKHFFPKLFNSNYHHTMNLFFWLGVGKKKALNYWKCYLHITFKWIILFNRIVAACQSVIILAKQLFSILQQQIGIVFPNALET